MKWVVVGHASNPEVDEIMKIIHDKTGIIPKYFATYGPIAAFIRSMDLPIDYPIAFVDGKYVGSIEDVKVWKQ